MKFKEYHMHGHTCQNCIHWCSKTGFLFVTRRCRNKASVFCGKEKDAYNGCKCWEKGYKELWQ